MLGEAFEWGLKDQDALLSSGCCGNASAWDKPSCCGERLQMDKKRKSTFAGAADLVAHAEAAAQYLKELHSACANGDKSEARRALRQAMGELELARAMLRIVSD